MATGISPEGLAFGKSGWILDRCPRCAGEHLYTVFDGERTNFLCRTCNRCWSNGTGSIRQVDTSTCPGCEWRPTCMSRWDVTAGAISRSRSTPPATPASEPGRAVEIGLDDLELSLHRSDPVLRLVARSPIQVGPDATLRELAGVLAAESVGAVLVRGPEGPIGIVSERDIVGSLASGADPGRVRVRDVMTPDLALVSSADTILNAADAFLAHDIRHLAVTTGSATVGVVSIRDVLAALADESRAG
jgi:CBS domain-containing protein